MKKLLKSITLICFILFSALFVNAAANGESELTIWYLDVGEGASAVIQCDGYYMLIDGGPADASDYVYSFLKSHEIKRFEYVVASHPDADHIGGISGALNYATAGVAFCTVLEYDTRTFSSFVRYLTEGGGKIIVPQAGDVFSLGTASVQILGPERGQVASDNTSIVLRIVYGNTSFLFTGDSEWADEEVLCDSGYTLKSDVLAVGHHGSKYSTSARLLKKVAPKYSIISVGENRYGHPTKEVLERLDDVGSIVYRTDENGTIVCRSDGETISFSTEKDQSVKYLIPNTPASVDIPETRTSGSAQQGQQPTFIGNKHSHLFHYPWCSSVKQMSEKNKVFFYGDSSEPEKQGYTACQKCKP